MPKTYIHITNSIVENKTHKNETFNWVHYNDVRFWFCRFTQCTWQHCKFNKTMFSRGTTFVGCRFVDCRFWGQYTYLGGPSKFEECVFENCRFDSVQLWAADFVNCSFSGQFRNLVFYGPEAPDGWATALISVDFSDVEMDLVDFRTGIDLSSVTLPKNA